MQFGVAPQCGVHPGNGLFFFLTKLILNFELMYFYLIKLDEYDWKEKDKYLLRILLVAFHKSLTTKWLEKEMPGADD